MCVCGVNFPLWKWFLPFKTFQLQLFPVVPLSFGTDPISLASLKSFPIKGFENGSGIREASMGPAYQRQRVPCPWGSRGKSPQNPRKHQKFLWRHLGNFSLTEHLLPKTMIEGTLNNIICPWTTAVTQLAWQAIRIKLAATGGIRSYLVWARGKDPYFPRGTNLYRRMKKQRHLTGG